MERIKQARQNEPQQEQQAECEDPRHQGENRGMTDRKSLVGQGGGGDGRGVPTPLPRDRRPGRERSGGATDAGDGVPPSGQRRRARVPAGRGFQVVESRTPGTASLHGAEGGGPASPRVVASGGGVTDAGDGVPPCRAPAPGLGHGRRGRRPSMGPWRTTLASIGPRRVGRAGGGRFR